MVSVVVIRGSTVQIQNTIKDFDGTLITPTSQSITIKDGGGNVIQTYTSPTAVSTGVYTQNYQTPANGTTGTWVVEWKVTYGTYDRIERTSFQLAA